MNRRISRRTWLASVPALGGLLMATGCSREKFIPPTVRGGLIGAADILTMSSNRLLLSGQQLAREFSLSDVADPFPTWNQTNPKNGEYQRHAAEGFKNWQLPISGLVARPSALSLDQIKGLAARTQITAHVCEQGWSAIGEWTGAHTLDDVLAVLEKADVPSGKIYSIADIVADMQYQARGMIEKHKLGDNAAGEVWLPGIVPKLSDTPGGTKWIGPKLGAHTAEILNEIGYDANAQADLKKRGII